MDIVTRSHADLIALVQQQQAIITELQALATRLERRLREPEGGDGPPSGMPGH